ncbi:DNA polymerase III subunit gamma/tau [Candidatus Saccharibacteria bacterium]|nr:DNA polymerase III subunit gamma/tau [Candidatus Saccharibacteria bacterium]
MGEALYRKYRPKSFDDVVGQDHIIKTLKNAIKSGRISHGYLLSGPRGVGKTSVARIIAYTINDTHYNDPNASLDIIEIDAASNRRIDEIRELRDKVNIAPSSSKYKVYIIDEVHMLTKEAFNALLKTLEEPPKHAVFILATTEAHKLPETIISRTQHFTFKLIPKKKTTEHLKALSKKESIKATDEALELIAHYGQGSFRDSVSLLDQASGIEGEINEYSILELVGAPNSDYAKSLLNICTNGNLKELLKKIDSYRSDGTNPAILSEQLLQLIRQRIASDNRSSHDIELMKRLIEVPASYDPDQALELSLISYSLNFISPLKNQSQVTKQSSATVIEASKIPPKKSKTKKQSDQKSNLTAEVWQDVLNQIKSKHNTLHGIAKMAEAEVSDGTLRLTLPYEFHKNRLQEKANLNIISSITQSITGDNPSIEITVKKNYDNKQSNDSEPTSNSLEVVSKIFGGGEVLD